MAFTSHSNLNFLAPPTATTTNTTTKRLSYIPVRCGPRGPRSQRGPLLKGRILSTEAIHAIQALKRAHRTTTHDPAALDVHVSKTLSRLIKSDLIAAFNELVRQDHLELAVKVFSAVRSEYQQPELKLYADLVNGLSRKGLTEEIDCLVSEMVEKEGVIQCDDKGLIRLLKGLIEAERKESTVKIYGLMRESGWGSTFEVDDYVGKVLSKGLRRMGEESLADEIDMELSKFSRGVLEKQIRSFIKEIEN